VMLQWNRIGNSDNSFGVKRMQGLHLCAPG
jgi:hypothetical protein